MNVWIALDSMYCTMIVPILYTILVVIAIVYIVSTIAILLIRLWMGIETELREP